MLVWLRLFTEVEGLSRYVFANCLSGATIKDGGKSERSMLLKVISLPMSHFNGIFDSSITT